MMESIQYLTRDSNGAPNTELGFYPHVTTAQAHNLPSQTKAAILKWQIQHTLIVRLKSAVTVPHSGCGVQNKGVIYTIKALFMAQLWL